METSRLLLRPLQLSDAPFILEFFNSPTFIQFIGDRGVRTVEDAEEFLKAKALKFFKEYSWGTYLVSLKSDGRPIGTCGLYLREELDSPDFGYGMLPEFEGQGYALEFCSYLLAHFKEQLQKDEFLAIVQDGNERSTTLLGKLGFLPSGKVTIGGVELLLYRCG